MHYRSSKFHNIVMILLASLLTAITVASFVPGISESKAQTVPSVQQTAKSPVTKTEQPRAQAPATKKKFLMLPSGLAAAQMGNFINIESRVGNYNVTYPSTDDLAMAATLCPDNTSVSAPVYLTGSYNQLAGSDEYVGRGEYDLTVTVKTTLTCLEK